MSGGVLCWRPNLPTGAEQAPKEASKRSDWESLPPPPPTPPSNPSPFFSLSDRVLQLSLPDTPQESLFTGYFMWDGVHVSPQKRNISKVLLDNLGENKVKDLKSITEKRGSCCFSLNTRSEHHSTIRTFLVRTAMACFTSQRRFYENRLK